MAMLVDPRTLGCAGVPAESRRAWRTKLRALYVDYALTAAAYAAAKAAIREGAVVVVDDAAPTDERQSRKRAAYESWSGSSDEDGSDDDEQVAPAPVDRALAPGLEFDACFKRYVKWCSQIDWRKMFPTSKLPLELDVLDDLRDADLGVVFRAMTKHDGDRTEFGFLPYMATHSRASVGSLLASSFCERINSAANLIVTKGNTLLADKEVDMCTTLRINKNFMSFMREHYADVSLQQFKMTVLTEHENAEY